MIEIIKLTEWQSWQMRQTSYTIMVPINREYETVPKFILYLIFLGQSPYRYLILVLTSKEMLESKEKVQIQIANDLKNDKTSICKMNQESKLILFFLNALQPVCLVH